MSEVHQMSDGVVLQDGRPSRYAGVPAGPRPRLGLGIGVHTTQSEVTCEPIMKPRHGDSKLQPNQMKKPVEKKLKPALASQYRAIGPAAVSAALICAPRQFKPKTASSK